MILPSIISHGGLTPLALGAWGGLIQFKPREALPPQGIFQIPRKSCRCDCDDARSGGNEDAHEKAARSVVFVPEHEDKNNSAGHKADQGDRATIDGSQRIQGDLRKRSVVPDMSEQSKCPTKRDKKGNGTNIHVREERIFEIDLESRGMGIPAFEVRFPK